MKIEVTITDLDKKILEANSVDIQEWIEGAVSGMINKQTKKLLKIAQEDLILDDSVEVIPASVKGIVELWLSKNYNSQETEDLNL